MASDVNELGYSKKIVNLVILGTVIAFMADGMDNMMMSMSLQAVIKDLGVSQLMAGTIGTGSLIGAGIGGLCAGVVADRIGRIKVITWSLVWFSVLTAGLAFCHTFNSFFWIRLLAGLGLGAEFSIGSVYVAEFISTKKRAFTLGILTAMWAVGYMIAALMASYLLPAWGWRPMFMIAIIPTVFAVGIRYFLPESPAWLKAQELKSKGITIAKKKDAGTYSIIFNDPVLRKTFLVWALANVFYLFGYYGAITWFPSYVQKSFAISFAKSGVYIALNYFAMFIGGLAGGRMADLWGRKKVFCGACIAIAILAPALVYFANPSNLMYLLLAFGFCYGIPPGIQGAFQAECWPTAVRGTGLGGTFNIGRLGSFLSPLFIGVLAVNYSIGAGIAALGVAYVLAAITLIVGVGEKQFDCSDAEHDLEVVA